MIGHRFVQDHAADYPTRRLCDLVGVPRSSFYAWRNHKPSARDIADEKLLEVIREIYDRSRGTYGVPRVYGQLRRGGRQVARSRVARLMRAKGLVGACAPKKWRRARPDVGGLVDLLDRDFTASAPNQRWVADITEFPTAWVLAIVATLVGSDGDARSEVQRGDEVGVLRSVGSRWHDSCCG